MLKEYIQRLHHVYQEKGLASATIALERSIGEYLLLEANHLKMKQIQGNGKPFCTFPRTSRVYAGAIAGDSFGEISNPDLDRIILESKTEFLSKIN